MCGKRQRRTRFREFFYEGESSYGSTNLYYLEARSNSQLFNAFTKSGNKKGQEKRSFLIGLGSEMVIIINSSVRNSHQILFSIAVLNQLILTNGKRFYWYLDSCSN
ncbi:CLUMA_CG018551, isoform A [Clunio marinus]|uniref:CLUMA_CG018551, isoform A n=1 Tax=Clunio marinus TaxID=568069 RepID=A0A1J1IZ87_9DIPT|nr:CLUMA_CG018551, isoform A [Clunio marinus]